jgi:hypothetical protein
MGSIHLAQNMVHWLAHVNTVKMLKDFLTS